MLTQFALLSHRVLRPLPLGCGLVIRLFPPTKVIGEKCVSAQGEDLSGRRVKKLCEGLGPTLHFWCSLV